MAIAIGQSIRDLSAQATDGAVFDISQLKGRNIILYFYPKDNTSGCTQEGKDFSELYSKFSALKTDIFGISRDSLKTHENFKKKYCFPFALITDADENFCNYFDVIKMKNMYGKKVRGIERSTFLIDKEGILRREWRKVKIEGHAEEVLQAIKELNKK